MIAHRRHADEGRRLAHGYFVRPDRRSRACRAITSCAKTELFVPSWPSRPCAGLDEALRAGERHRVRADRRLVLARAGGDRRLPRAHRGGRRLRQPRRRRDDRRVAGRAAVRRLEGQRLDGQEHRRPLHVALLPARAEPDMWCGAERAGRSSRPMRPLRGATWAELAAQPISIVDRAARAAGAEMIARALPYLSPSLIHCYPLMVQRASGCMVEDVDGNVYLDAEAGVATASTGHCHPRGGGGDRGAGRGADPHLRHRLPLPGLRRDLREARRSWRALQIGRRQRAAGRGRRS